MSVEESQLVVEQKVRELVVDSLCDVLEMSGRSLPADIRSNGDVPLFGREALLDSLGLVSLVVDVEQRMEEAFGLVLSLADDRAMSQRRSPFRSVDTFVRYILEMAEAERGG